MNRERNGRREGGVKCRDERWNVGRNGMRGG